jgi:hypothetical protein
MQYGRRRKTLYNNTKAGMGTHPQEVKGKRSLKNMKAQQSTK